MFKFNALESIHLEITSRCQAKCPMCSRNYRGGIDNPNLKLSDWTIDDFKNIITLDVLNQINSIYFCGNFGDPIINDNLLEMCRYIKNFSPNCGVRIHTNGGARKNDWWKELKSCLPNKHIVIFGIDGLEDTHHIYRVGTNYNTVINNANSFISAGGNAEWVFIKFKHNEHQVDEAERRAREYGFRNFTVKNSTRFMETKFKVLDQDNTVKYYLEPPSDNAVVLVGSNMIKKFRSWVNETEIHCYVQQNKEIYIDAHKKLFPCCFIASTPYNYIETGSIIEPAKIAIKDQYDILIQDLGGIETLDLNYRSISDIIDSDIWQTIWSKYWNDKKLITCARTCGINKNENISKPKDQFIKRINF